MFKQKIKRALNFFGLEIKKIRKSKEKFGNKEEENIDNIEEKRKYYYTEGLRFKCLKKYEFKTILDIGANEGQFAGKILTIFPGAQIHCFEPLKEAFEQLKLNFSDSKNITFHDFGLGNEEKTVNIYKNEYSPSSSLLEMLDLHKINFDFAVNTEAETIKIKKLDEVLFKGIEKPVLIKIDVQGYEKFVLDGGLNTINQADVIIIETSFVELYANQALFDEIYQLLKDLGFVYSGSIEQLVTPDNKEIVQQDALFVRKYKV
jgi:FkbM family methyltransferase